MNKKAVECAIRLGLARVRRVSQFITPPGDGAAPESSLPLIRELVRPRVPTVLPLAEPGMVAVHALVPAPDIWRLLPELEAAGGSSILIVPVERMAA